VSTHTEYYSRATKAINEITTLNLAFNKLYNLQTEWAERLADLAEKKDKVIEEKTEPIPFDWDNKISQLKAAWRNFILELKTTYQVIEERYFV